MDADSERHLQTRGWGHLWAYQHRDLNKSADNIPHCTNPGAIQLGVVEERRRLGEQALMAEAVVQRLQFLALAIVEQPPDHSTDST